MKRGSILAPVDPRICYKRQVFSGYKKNDPKMKIKKYNPFPQENIQVHFQINI